MTNNNIDAPSKSYETYRGLDFDSKLTLQEFVDLFNENDENPFWDLFYLETNNDNTKLIPRSYCTIS